MSKWQDVLEIKNGRDYKKVKDENGEFPIYGSGGIMGYANDFICPPNTVIIGRKGNINNPIFVDRKFWNVDTAFGLVANEKYLNPKYLYYFCMSFDFEKLNTTVTIPSLTKSNLLKIEMCLPPFEVQIKMVEILDKIQEVIYGYKKQLEELDNLIKAIFYDMFGDPVQNDKGWSKKRLKDVAEIITGNTPPRADKTNYGNYIEWIKSDNIVKGSMYLTQSAECLSEKGYHIGRYVDKDSILMTCIAGSVSSIGNVALTDRKVAFNQQINGIVPIKCNCYYIYVLFAQTQQYIQNTINMSLKGILSKGKLSELEFIIPPLELQNKFAEKLKKIEEQKSIVKKSLKESQNLFNSLMSKYFD